MKSKNLIGYAALFTFIYSEQNPLSILYYENSQNHTIVYPDKATKWNEKSSCIPNTKNVKISTILILFPDVINQ